MFHLFAVDIRKFFTILGVFFAFTLVSACSSQEQKSVVKNYINAAANNRVEEVIEYFALKNKNENDSIPLKEKQLARIDHLYTIIQKNKGLKSFSTDLYNKNDETAYASVNMNFTNGKTEKIIINLINESGKWKITPFQESTEIEVENYIRAVADSRIKDAFAFFPIDNSREEELVRMTQNNFQKKSSESRISAKEVFSSIVEEANVALQVRAMAKIFIENLASSIQENGGLDSISTTTNDTTYGDKALVEAYIKYKNGVLEKRRFQLINVYRWKWKIILDKTSDKLLKEPITMDQYMILD
ncbi:MAG: DUF4878 domain-containing protein [Betaproteobacteria bacterium]|nr:DUF4878 domain-containing protein [Betaproteobacteria bacterium]